MVPAVAWEWRWQLRLFVALTAVKILLVPSYYSTDFEVHRNWAAITNSLPLQKWYIEATSPWTLDYPPLFAWFEALVACFAKRIDPAMLDVNNLNYASASTIWFQRVSVMVTDLVLAMAATYAVAERPALEQRAAFAAVVGSGGLLMVDHIHFQYNGMLLGLLVASVALAEKGRLLWSAAIFAAVVNMKHLFAAAGPPFAVFLLRSCCRRPGGAAHLASLVVVVAAVCATSLGPFVAKRQLSTVLARLFPFGRGLCHSYWAPNAWALYAAADRVTAAALARLTDTPKMSSDSSLTGGLVGGVNFAVLAPVGPSIAAAATIVAQLPALIALWLEPQHTGQLTEAVVLSLMSSFVWGYHVHEKAILMVLIPMAVNAAHSRRAANSFLLVAAVAHHSLFPLLHQPREWPIKVLIALLYFLSIRLLLSIACPGVAPDTEPHGGGEEPRSAASDHDQHDNAKHPGRRKDGRSTRHILEQAASAEACGTTEKEDDTFRGVSVGRRGEAGAYLSRSDSWCLDVSSMEAAFLWGLLPLELYCTLGHKLVFGRGSDVNELGQPRLAFLPLLLTSVYCAVGIIWAWAKMEVAVIARVLVTAKTKPKIA